MNYIVKILPARGEIQVGDLVSDTLSGEMYRVEQSHMEDINSEDESGNRDSNRVKAYLFGVEDYRKQYEISKHATWIKQNDVIKEDQIELCWQPGGEDSETWNLVPIRQFSVGLPPEAHIVAKLKCPCCDSWK